jgi:aspartyl-tRNA(Asn)/glutamyl-tRNA(Gln) amidotransferase subunit A
VSAAVGRAREGLSAAGAVVHEVALPDPDELQAVFLAGQAEEALAWHRATGRWPTYADRYGADVAARLRLAESLDQSAASRRDALRVTATRIFDTVAVLLTPVAASGPSTVADPDHMRVDGVVVDLRLAVLPHALLASLCGLPACAVPVGMDEDGLPIGVQVIGRQGADELVLDVAELIEDHAIT